jgi:hypothetical protein
MRAGVPTANVYPADDSSESLDSGSDERGSIWCAMVGLSPQLCFQYFDNRGSTDQPNSRLTGSLPVGFALRYIAIRRR